VTNYTELWVNRDDFRSTKIAQRENPPLSDGEIRVSIDKFGLTANNVSYALTGDMIGYWKAYPVNSEDNEPWGRVPAWGCADVIESNCDDIAVGERLWGFFPMASHAVLKAGKVKPERFLDISEHRRALATLYNTYRRTDAEPELVKQFENERCLFLPSLGTSFIVYDYLVDNHLFGAEQVLIGSASSKTGFGVAKMLRSDANVDPKLVGITSPGNRDFVEGLGCFDQVVLYGEEDQIDASKPTAYIDMSGDVRLTTAVHKHVGENVVCSSLVGASHWEQGGEVGELPGAEPTFFFAPTQFAKRQKEWGESVLMMKAMQTSFAVAADIKKLMSIEWINDPKTLQKTWLDLLDNRVPASRGLMVSLA